MLYNELQKNPSYFYQCVIIKKISLILIYSLALSFIGYEKNMLLFSCLSFFLISPNPRVQLTVLGLSSLAAFYIYETNLFSFFGIFILGCYWGGLMSILIHNTSHEIIKPAWLNRLLGELAGFFLGIGFINFLYIHIQHHIHSDDEEDPHHNMDGYSFLNYWGSMGKNITKSFKHYLPVKVCKNKSQYHYLIFSVILNKFLLIHILLICFGEELFAFFSIPCIIASQVLFAYINYYTHPNKDHNREEVIDLDDTLVDKVINRLFFGVLFHKTHHKRPKVSNPMKYQQKKGLHAFGARIV